MENPFVDTQWLWEHLNDPGIRIVDLRCTSAFATGKNVLEACREDYVDGHIPGAVFLDCLHDLTDPSFQFIAFVSPPEHFSEVMSRAGIGDGTLVVVYDDGPLPLASARLWWTLHYYGHTEVKILDGGFLQWVWEDRPLSKDVPTVPRKTFTPKIQAAIRATKETVRRSLGDPGTVLVDCLPFEQYNGSVSNAWGVRKGHIPGAVCLPYLATGMGMEKAYSNEARMEAVNSDHPLHFLPIEELRALFTHLGVGSGKRVITYCGKGYASCNVFLALKLIGFRDATVYDGSIAEWSRDRNLPMEKSEETTQINEKEKHNG
ncbi:MAG: sulfurtransferase [Pseudomonadota bacterium]